MIEELKEMTKEEREEERASIIVKIDAIVTTLETLEWQLRLLRTRYHQSESLDKHLQAKERIAMEQHRGEKHGSTIAN